MLRLETGYSQVPEPCTLQNPRRLVEYIPASRLGRMGVISISRAKLSEFFSYVVSCTHIPLTLLSVKGSITAAPLIDVVFNHINER
jgi:hypothetical protein